MANGRRSKSCTSLTGKLLFHGIPPDITHELVLCWNLRNDPPEDEAKLSHTIRRIIARDLAQREVIEMAGPTIEELQQEWDRQHGGANGEWRTKLKVTPTQQPRPILFNALCALREAPEWQGVLVYDELALTVMVAKPPPWQMSQHNDWIMRRWTDRDDVLTTEWLQHAGIGVPVSVTRDAVQAIARASSFNPIRDYLTSLEWDSTKRVQLFAHKYLGAENDAYHAAVGKCTLVASVARVMSPGCKADHIPILEGEQGTLKSTVLHTLYSPWFSDDLSELGTKDSKMEMNGVWCLEIAELTSMRKTDVERVKAFASRRTDRFRPAYGKHVIEMPRQCVCIGTTNADRYLKDESGARRFWPIRCGVIDIVAVKRDRDQIWAEAVALYLAGEPWWLTDATDVEAARDAQDARYVEDTWDEAITEYVYAKDEVAVSDVLEHAIGLTKDRWDQWAQSRVASCLKNQRCWRRGQKGSGRERKWVYRRIPVSQTTPR